MFPSAVRPLLAKLGGRAVSYATVRVLGLDQFSVPQEVARLNQSPHLNITARHRSGDYELNIEATGASRVVMDCPGCVMQIRGGVEKEHLGIKVKHIAELLAENMKH